jgi:hypothetical protein
MTDYFARIPSGTKLVVNTSRPEGPIIHHEDCNLHAQCESLINLGALSPWLVLDGSTPLE